MKCPPVRWIRNYGSDRDAFRHAWLRRGSDRFHREAKCDDFTRRSEIPKPSLCITFIYIIIRPIIFSNSSTGRSYRISKLVVSRQHCPLKRGVFFYMFSRYEFTVLRQWQNNGKLSHWAIPQIGNSFVKKNHKYFENGVIRERKQVMIDNQYEMGVIL